MAHAGSMSNAVSHCSMLEHATEVVQDRLAQSRPVGRLMSLRLVVEGAGPLGLKRGLVCCVPLRFLIVLVPFGSRDFTKFQAGPRVSGVRPGSLFVRPATSCWSPCLTPGDAMSF